MKGHIDRDVKYTEGAKKSKPDAFIDALVKIKFDVTTKKKPDEPPSADVSPNEVKERGEKRKRDDEKEGKDESEPDSDDDDVKLEFGDDASADDIELGPGKRERLG